MKRKTVVEIVAGSLAALGALFVWKKTHSTKFIPAWTNILPCARCEKLMRARYPMKLVAHLIDDHKLPEDAALDKMLEYCQLHTQEEK